MVRATGYTYVTRRRKRLSALTSITVGAVVVSGCAGIPAAEGNSVSTASQDEPVLGGGFDWRECTEEEVSPPPPEWIEDPPPVEIPDELLCAEATVPVDHDDPDARTTTLQVASLPHTGEGASQGTVLYVAGGPGVPGIPDLPHEVETVAELREDFDVVGWNARGTMGETAELLPTDVCAYGGPKEVDPQTPEEFDDVVAEHTAAMDECRDHDPELFDSLDTLQHVGDMEAIRVGLGLEQIHLYAQSHGAVRATAYADLHPERLAAAFVDSGVNRVSGPEFADATLLAELESQFEALGQWCADAEECALRGEDVEERWQELLGRASEEPIPAGEMSFSRAQLALLGGSLVKSEVWEPYADAVSETLEHGDATPFLEIMGGEPFFAPNIFVADVCGDSVRFDDFEGYQEVTERTVGHSENFGYGRSMWYVTCAAWPGEDANPPGPIDPEGVPPFLFTASELEYAQSEPIADMIPGSVAVEVEGTGHGLYFYEGNSCVIEHANRYFVEGTLPDEGTFCELD